MATYAECQKIDEQKKTDETHETNRRRPKKTWKDGI